MKIHPKIYPKMMALLVHNYLLALYDCYNNLSPEILSFKPDLVILFYFTVNVV